MQLAGDSVRVQLPVSSNPRLYDQPLGDYQCFRQMGRQARVETKRVRKRVFGAVYSLLTYYRK